jgi:hypothetical protein
LPFLTRNELSLLRAHTNSPSAELERTSAFQWPTGEPIVCTIVIEPGPDAYYVRVSHAQDGVAPSSADAPRVFETTRRWGEPHIRRPAGGRPQVCWLDPDAHLRACAYGEERDTLIVGPYEPLAKLLGETDRGFGFAGNSWLVRESRLAVAGRFGGASDFVNVAATERSLEPLTRVHLNFDPSERVSSVELLIPPDWSAPSALADLALFERRLGPPRTLAPSPHGVWRWPPTDRRPDITLRELTTGLDVSVSFDRPTASRIGR